MSKDLSYRKSILRELYFANTISCTELSEMIGKSIPLTNRLVNSLIEDGYVVETGLGASTGGRRALNYSFKEDAIYIVSVAIDQLITSITIIDMQNRYVTGIEQFALPLTKNLQALNLLTEKIEKFIAKSGIEKDKIVGVGIGMPGFVDIERGINYTYLNVENKRIDTFIGNKIGLPVFIDNDSSLIALAELRFGAAINRKNALVINVNWGIGLGLIFNGALFRGHNGFAGEFSHIPLFTNNKLCSCGKSGCLETEASLLVVIEKAREGLKAGKLSLLKELPADNQEEACNAIINAANKGDKYSVELLSEAGYTIGRGLSILIHLLNPELIIVSGKGSLAGKILQAPLQQALNEHCIPSLAASTTIKISSLGVEAELIGAAALVMENFEKTSIALNTSKKKIATYT